MAPERGAAAAPDAGNISRACEVLPITARTGRGELIRAAGVGGTKTLLLLAAQHGGRDAIHCVALTPRLTIVNADPPLATMLNSGMSSH